MRGNRTGVRAQKPRPAVRLLLVLSGAARHWIAADSEELESAFEEARQRCKRRPHVRTARRAQSGRDSRGGAA